MTSVEDLVSENLKEPVNVLVGTAVAAQYASERMSEKYGDDEDNLPEAYRDFIGWVDEVLEHPALGVLKLDDQL